MELIVLFISVDVIASKFLDSYIRFYRGEDAANFRANPVLRTIFGNDRSHDRLWLSFFMTVFAVGLSLALLNNILPESFQWLYIMVGIYTIMLNMGSAHSSYFGRPNLITEKLRK